MRIESSPKNNSARPATRTIIFPVAVLVAYGILFVAMPNKASLALKSSGNIFLNMLMPLGLVFILMLLLNLFLKPTQIARFLGKGSGIKGVLLPAAAGIVSAGPIYVWYPLLKELRGKGAGNSPIVIFLYNRAVKPFLLPVMIAYFGWEYAVILTLLTILGSIPIGYCVSVLMKEEASP